MKKILVKITRDMIKRYLPLIINAVCASICVGTAGCTLAAEKIDLSINPIERSSI